MRTAMYRGAREVFLKAAEISGLAHNLYNSTRVESNPANRFAQNAFAIDLEIAVYGKEYLDMEPEDAIAASDKTINTFLDGMYSELKKIRGAAASMGRNKLIERLLNKGMAEFKEKVSAWQGTLKKAPKKCD